MAVGLGARRRRRLDETRLFGVGTMIDGALQHAFHALSQLVHKVGGEAFDGPISVQYAVVPAELLDNADGTTPVLVIGLSLLVLVPVLVVVGVILKSYARRSEAARERPATVPRDTSRHVSDETIEAPSTVRAKETQHIEIKGAKPASPSVDDAERGIATQALRRPPRPAEASISVRYDEGGTPKDANAKNREPQRFAFGRVTMLRIGREADNEIVLEAPTVHRYHAVIQRTPDAGYVITDLSRENGNGVFVNGQRIAEAQLRSGDEIRLGTAVLAFVLG